MAVEYTTAMLWVRMFCFGIACYVINRKCVYLYKIGCEYEDRGILIQFKGIYNYETFV